MFEFHGWAVLQDGPGAEGGFPEGNVEAELRERVDVRRGGSALVDVRWVNAQLMLHFAGHSNHRGGSEDFVELFRWVAGRAPGAYGLLYFHDDEDPSEEQRDRFQVLTMARGRISERADPFLSPRTPVIEDELTWDDL